MDFSKFRGSGDLSDITVMIEDREHKLHKFPLYARSDYFCERARNGPDADSAREILHNFPGGNETFEAVADFCYNMPIDMSKSNIVAIRSAAEYLKMFGHGNLVDVSEKYLGDTISAAKLNRASPAIVDLLLQCKAVRAFAEKAGVVESCIDALVECWTKPQVHPGAFRGAFTKVTPMSHEVENLSAFKRLQNQKAEEITQRMDEQSINGLMSIYPEWFAEILTRARDKDINCAELGALSVRYVTSVIDKGENDVTSETALLSETTQEPTNKDDSNEKDTDTTVPGAITTNSQPKPLTGALNDDSVDFKEVLDKVLLVLPEEAFDIPPVTMEWLTKVLRIATSNDCQCRNHLVRVAGERLIRLDPEDLCGISPSVLHDIVVDIKENNPKTVPDDTIKVQPSKVYQERACKLVDTYMTQMVSKETLDSETFKLLASATQTYPRVSHDAIYEILEYVLQSEKGLSPQKRSELAELVNFDLVSETYLQRALEKETVSGSAIAASAIKLCGRLRSELDSIKFIAETQEEEIQKYQKATVSSSGKVKHHTPYSSTPQSFESRRLHGFSPRERSLDSGYADQKELSRSKLSLPHEEEEEEATDPDEDANSDPMEAAHNVLTAARHKLALPMYTGYRPALLRRLSPTSTGSGSHNIGNHHSSREHDITSEDEQEFRSDRTFRSLDPRVRHQRYSGQPSHSQYHHGSSSSRTYFPYSHFSSSRY